MSKPKTLDLNSLQFEPGKITKKQLAKIPPGTWLEFAFEDNENLAGLLLEQAQCKEKGTIALKVFFPALAGYPWTWGGVTHRQIIRVIGALEDPMKKQEQPKPKLTFGEVPHGSFFKATSNLEYFKLPYHPMFNPNELPNMGRAVFSDSPDGRVKSVWFFDRDEVEGLCADK